MHPVQLLDAFIRELALVLTPFEVSPDASLRETNPTKRT